MAPRKTTTLVQCLGEIADPRSGNSKRHDLVEVLVIAICVIFSEVQGFEDMAAEWARAKETWLRRFLVQENGIPAHDTFNRIFRILDPTQYEQVFRRWVGSVGRSLRQNLAIGSTAAAWGGLKPARHSGDWLGGPRLAADSGQSADGGSRLRVRPTRNCIDPGRHRLAFRSRLCRGRGSPSQSGVCRLAQIARRLLPD